MMKIFIILLLLQILQTQNVDNIQTDGEVFEALYELDAVNVNAQVISYYSNIIETGIKWKLPELPDYKSPDYEKNVPDDRAGCFIQFFGFPTDSLRES